MPTWNMMIMQDPANMVSVYMSITHNTIMEVMIAIATFISVLMIFLLKNKATNRMITQNNKMEILWTILPMIILIYMASPSLQLLYIMEESNTPSMTIKSVGHQWYWTYEYPDFMKTFDSYMMTEKSQKKFRLMDVDNRMIMPFKIFTRILCSSTDVIHSWTIPSLGVKMDAMPGRVNQMIMYPSMMGVYYGQCSEICGMNHSFMPIVVEIVKTKMFINWIKVS
uniref:Cytochrome c oxidase subunit 2 n=1 Tax=Wallacidia oculata TaxID=590134 RepID=E0WBN5_9HYME|nr:cytochrome c oxidase subunit II [Wallacidia oculata]